MSHTLLIGNGEKIALPRLQQLARQAHLIVAADGGCGVLLQAGIVPDWVIGDLDSLPATDAKKIPPQRLVHIPTQENNDLEKALSFLVKKGVRSCTLAGFTGGRFDFSLGNLLLLRRFARKLQLHLAGNEWDFFLLTHTRHLSCAKGARASLLPLTACGGVSLAGFVYPLHQARLNVGTTRTLSNQTTRTAVTVSLKSGILGVYLETKPQK